MQAITLKNFGGVENLQIENIPTPQIADSEVLIEVKAISINPVDAKVRSGKGLAAKLKEFNPIILGWDVSGIVKATGKNVQNFKNGDEVFGVVNFPGHGKAYAEYVAAPSSHLALKPANITHPEAAAATIAALTAWQAIMLAKVKAGDRVLIHAAAGGVGHYAVQIAKHLGAYVIGTSSDINKEFVLSLGADEHIDYKTQPFEDNLKNIDFVLDTIGGDIIDRSLETMKKGGTLISIPSGLNEAVVEKSEAKGVNGYRFLVQSSGSDMQQIANLLEKGIIHSHVSQIFSFQEMAEAHLQIETGKTQGKIVVSI